MGHNLCPEGQGQGLQGRVWWELGGRVALRGQTRKLLGRQAGSQQEG